ncbi:hypothetical protein [Bradyrhizobium glycinis]|uniref:hypothetical protein n=1 Tax=Bradyrhizobium glycinis TaxID=2751812 RepID=UPI0018D88DE9|nr:hypothetical protein [Bradyrhizobium glycinis]MBH5369002.1 hypothetical protein [Bradyrhizobium glycinis]
MSSTIANTMGTASDPAPPLGSDVELNSTGKWLVRCSVISVLFLGQIAYNIGEFPLALDLVCYALTVAYLLASGHASLSVPSLFICISAIALAAFRIPFATSSTSWSSLLLLAALYAPFCFRLARRQDLDPVLNYTLKTYVLAASTIAAIAVAQFVLVNGAKIKPLTNIYFVLPPSVRGAGFYTFLREEGGIIKANGFFLREAADLSLVTGLALLIELRSTKRPILLGLLSAGLICSFSGSGIVACLAGLLLPKTLGRIPVFVASAVGLFLLLTCLYGLDLPFLKPWFDRLSELGKTGTSGYARFVAPMEMVQMSFDGGVLKTWLGNGAGSFFRDVTLGKFRYEVADPTWAKATYEYGVLGLFLFLTLVIVRLYSSALNVEACHFLLISWISFSFLLKPGYSSLIWLLTLVPNIRRTSRR